MFGYYLELAVRSLRRNVVLTALMIAAVGVGIGASMTMLTTLRAMSGDPLPDRSSQLFVPQIDVWGPDSRRQNTVDRLPDQISYLDAMALMRARRGVHQTATYAVEMDVDPGSGSGVGAGRPFTATGRAAYRDFFTMFEVPFASGAPWSAAADEGRADVVVLSAKLADRLFPGGDAVGRSVNLDGREYRVAGVLQPWNPLPRFYDTNSNGSGFADTEDFYVPFSNAVDRQIETAGNLNCTALPPSGWEGLLASNCVWLQFWVQLPTAAAVREFRSFLYNYAAEQRRSGRFHWPARVELYDLNEWMVHEQVVPQQVRVNTFIGLGFLVVCLINAVGLMLAKFGARAGDLGVRRALGGSRLDIFLQCLVETGLVGFVGGVLGVGLTAAGLAVDRALLAPVAKNVQLDRLTQIDGGMLIIILAVAVAATICAGLYPTWQASRVQPAWQLKVQ